MTNSSLPSLDTVSTNNRKIDQTLDAIVEAVQGTDQTDRRDVDQIEKTSQLMLFLSLLIGDSNPESESDSI